MRNLVIKRGSAFQLTITAANADGTTFDMNSVSWAGEIRDARGVLIATLTVVPSATAGVGTVTVADTTAWPEGLLRGALLISDNGLPTETQTFGIDVRPAVVFSQPAPAAFNPVTSS